MPTGRDRSPSTSHRRVNPAWHWLASPSAKIVTAFAAVAAVTFAYFGAPQQAARADQTNAARAPATPVDVSTVAKGLRNPWGLQFLPDGRMLVTERPGSLRVVTPDGSVSQPVSGVPAVHARGQGGLLDVRLSADFASSAIVYLSYAEPRGSGASGTAVVRGRLTLAQGAGGGTLDDVKVIFRQEPARATGHHYGSRIVPASDGTLFVTTGDRGNGDLSQDPATTVGKVVRITSDGAPAPDNPRKPGWSPLVFSIGHRNIQGAALDGQGRLWTVEHGARGGDELNQPRAGLNYGWPVISYGRNYNMTKIGVGTAKEGLEQPVYYWDPSIATSGLAIYDGDLFTGWKGNMLVGGLAGAQLSRLEMKDGAVAAEEVLLADEGLRIRDVRVGPDGAVYLLIDETDGSILKLTPKG